MVLRRRMGCRAQPPRETLTPERSIAVVVGAIMAGLFVCVGECCARALVETGPWVFPAIDGFQRELEQEGRRGVVVRADEKFGGAVTLMEWEDLLWGACGTRSNKVKAFEALAMVPLLLAPSTVSLSPPRFSTSACSQHAVAAPPSCRVPAASGTVNRIG